VPAGDDLGDRREALVDLPVVAKAPSSTSNFIEAALIHPRELRARDRQASVGGAFHARPRRPRNGRPLRRSQLRLRGRTHADVHVAGKFACPGPCPLRQVALGQRLEPPSAAAVQPLAVARTRFLAAPCTAPATGRPSSSASRPVAQVCSWCLPLFSPRRTPLTTRHSEPFFARKVKAFFEKPREFSSSFSGLISAVRGVRTRPPARMEMIWSRRWRGVKMGVLRRCGKARLLVVWTGKNGRSC